MPLGAVARRAVRPSPAPTPVRPLRILMIAPTSFFADYGCHVRILEECRILTRLGHQVSVCTYHNGRDLDGLDIRRTMSIPWRQHYEVGSSRHKIGFDLLLVARTLTAMRQFRPDLIHAHLHEGALIGYLPSKLWRVPLIFDFQGSMTSEMVDHHFLSRDGLLYEPLYRLERAINRLPTQILTSSARAAKLLVNTFACPKDRITHVPDCVNTDLFSPRVHEEHWRQRRRAWGLPADAVVVVYLGLLAEYQGIDLLLEAARRICSQRDKVYFLIGGYPNVEHYGEMARALGIENRVIFTGKVRYEGAPDLLALGDIAVAPKLSKTEGAGKLLNYMAMALPTVAFDTEVCREYLDEHGIYADYGDSSSLADCLIWLSEQPETGLRLGAALRARASQEYSWERAAETILKVYDTALG